MLRLVTFETWQRGRCRKFFIESLYMHLLMHIPRRSFSDVKHSHPWLTKTCEEAIAHKNSCEGTDAFPAARDRCTQVIDQAYRNHVAELKIKIAALPKGSKLWWKLNRELLNKKCKTSSIPPLRVQDTWILDSYGKANAFAQAWMDKAKLPPDHCDCIFMGPPDHVIDFFTAFRTRFTLKKMRQLKTDKATGEDQISALVLKRLAPVLAAPFTQLCRRLFYEACWPTRWQIHLLCPIYKRASVYAAGNYRGVHLTSILSKLAEHVIGRHLFKFLQDTAFGTNQWAFSEGRSAQDLVTMLVMSWTLEIGKGNVIGAYLSDISTAFDRVFKDYLMAKLHNAGVGEIFLRFFNAYLQPRTGKVVVEGMSSDTFELSNTVFQGTVLGPCLWNVFFADVCVPASSTGGQEAMFADDLNVFQVFNRTCTYEVIMAALQSCRDRVHRWGKNQRVIFDASKEHLQVIHPLHGHGEDFKLLGCVIDVKLVMANAIQNLLSQARPKVKAILRTRAHYDVASLIMQYKTHIWGIFESRNGAIYHASDSHLDRIDSLQRGFLHELGISEQEAFTSFNFAPPTLRRDIGMLGFIHKRVLGLAHPRIEGLLPWYTTVFTRPRMGHNKQLYNNFREVHFQIGLFSRSIFCLVDLYNNLSQTAVDCTSVSSFQAYLTHLVRVHCQNGSPRWQYSFNTRSR
jgi:hypothetical protein